MVAVNEGAKILLVKNLLAEIKSQFTTQRL